MDATKTVTDAAKSAFTLKNVLLFIFSLLLIFLALDFFGMTGWILQPVTTFKDWNAKRKAKAATT